MSRFRRYTRESLPPRPAAGVFVSGIRDDFWADTSTRKLTPAKLGSILSAALTGDISRQAEVWDKIEEDPHVLATYGRRKSALLRRRIDFEPADKTARAKEAADLCREAFDGISNLTEGLRHLQDAIGRAFSVCQIIWELQGSRWMPAALEWWKQRDFVLDENDPDAVRVLTDGEQTKGEPLMPGQWVVHRYKARSGSLAEASLFRGIAWAWLFKHFSWQSWAIANEAYGTPRRIGTYPRGAADAEIAAVKAATFLLGRDGAAVIPEGAKLELLESKGSTASTAQSPFEAMIQRCDRYVSKLFLGGTLTTEESSTGTQALGTVHADVEDDLEESDGEALSGTLRAQLCAPICHFNLGADAPVPRVKLVSLKQEDLGKRIAVDKGLAELGLPLSVEELRETYRRRAPAGDGDALLMPRSSPPSAMSDEEFLRRVVALAEKKRSMTWAI